MLTNLTMYFIKAFECQNMPEKPLCLTRINCWQLCVNVSAQRLATPLLLHLYR